MLRASGTLIKGAFSRPQSRLIHHIDEKWLQNWGSNIPRPKIAEKSPSYYQIPMFPYPSGRLHIGHLRVYTISDTLARFRRMRGFKVVHPIGWDAFGLPAENAAIDNGVNASDWTYNHIDVMREQLKRMLVSFDWDREVITCHPDYYKHTQQIFLQLLNAGLAYRRKALVNWDPVDKTVLANEQIDGLGRSWRSGAIAEQKKLEQWFLKITRFASELQKDLNLLGDWPEKVKRMQKQWIGVSSGVEVKFSDNLWAYTTRIETLPSVEFVAVAEEHPLAKLHAADTRPNGLIEGLEALHPLTKQPLPVYVAPYVVSAYGSGAVMGVPSFDERDRLFWTNLGNSRVISPHKEATAESIVEVLEAEQLGRKVTHTRLRDWLISRQRFWGAPIPVVHCKSCGIVPVPESDLPVKLPSDTNNVPLSQNTEWLKTQCPSCHGPAKRDPDTMDTFMDSSWYFFRFLDSQNKELPFSFESASDLPVDCYVGGVEHAILHLLYSRFLSKFLAKQGMWSGGDLKGEPFRKLVTQGMVHGKTYKDKTTGRYMKPNEILQTPASEMVISMEKMSKSKYNGVDPLEVIEKHGADATRAHMLFQAGIFDTLDWDADKIVGIERWLAKLFSLGQTLARPGNPAKSSAGANLWNRASDLVASITRSLNDTLSLNTVISDYMKLTKLIVELSSVNTELAKRAHEVLLKVIAPVCPAHAEELWEQVLISQNKPWTSIHEELWPEMPKLADSSMEVEYKVLVDSRPQKPILAAAGATQDELLSILNLDSPVLRVIFKPNIRLLSIVTNQK